MKKFWRIFLVCSLLASMLLPVPAGAEGSESLWEYAELEDGTVMITAYHGTETAVAVPKELGGRKVTKIGSWAFNECESPESISIPDSVLEIGANPFGHCTGLKEIIVSPAHPSLEVKDGMLISMPDSRLVSVFPRERTACDVPEGIREIGDAAFCICRNLKSVGIPRSVKRIGDNAFNQCRSLVSAVIPEGAEIGDFLFIACSSLESVTLPEGLERITIGMFELCTSLKAVEIPTTVKVIDDLAFVGCESLESITIPDGVKKIGFGVFTPTFDMEDDTSLAIHPCLSLKTVVLPDSMTEIGDLAFMGCIFLESVTIPESVVMFGTDIFSKCPVVKVTVRPDSPAQKYCDKNGTPYILAEE